MLKKILNLQVVDVLFRLWQFGENPIRSDQRFDWGINRKFEIGNCKSLCDMALVNAFDGLLVVFERG